MTDNEADRAAIRDCDRLRAKARPSADETLALIHSLMHECQDFCDRCLTDDAKTKRKAIFYSQVWRIMGDYWAQAHYAHLPPLQQQPR